MSATLQNFFNIHAAPGDRVVDVVLMFRNSRYSGAAFLLALVAGYGVIWMYRRTEGEVSAFRRYLMAGLRILLVCILLLILMQPTLRVTTASHTRSG